ncbi:MAG TPA: hypothetical protein VFO46_02505 [Candidatus Sulfotelmatobacter sp.]|nr:hypothetical protein [Candidatus Sulfotelmatobacter sp.]
MPSIENIGSVSVSLTADPSQLNAAISQAQTTASAGGARIAAAFNSAVGPATALTTATNTTASASTTLARQTTILASSQQAAAAAANVHAAALGHQVSEIQATSGALRVLEGSGALRAAERFVATTLGIGGALQAIFPIVGAIAFGEAIFRAGEHLGKMLGLWGEVSEEVKKAAEQAAAVDKEVQSIAQRIAGIQDRKFGLQFGQAAAKAKEAADATAAAQRDQVAIQMLQNRATEEESKLKAAIALSGYPKMSIEEAASVRNSSQAFRDQVAQYRATQRELNELQLKASEDTQKAGLLSLEALKASGDATEKQRERTEELNSEGIEAAHRHAEALRRGDEQNLAAIQTQHELSTRELIAYWRNRLSTERDSAERVREIGKIIGELTQKQFREDRTAHEENARMLQEWAARYQKILQQVADSNDQTARRFEEAGNKYAAEASKREADAAKRAFEPKPEIAQIPITASVEQRVSPALKALHALDIAGIQTIQTEQRYLDTLNQAAAAAASINAPIGERLEIERRILEEEIRIKEQSGEDASNQIKALAAVREREAHQRAISRGFGGAITEQIGGKDLLDQAQIATAHLLQQGINGVSNSLARAVVQGKHFGQALRDLGKELAVSALTAALQMLITKIISMLMATKAVESAVNVAKVTSEAGVGAAAGFASVMEAVPFPENIALAPGVAAATFAEIMGYAGAAAYAAGGFPEVGVPAIVGEQGPELFVPTVPGMIFPAGSFATNASNYTTNSAQSATVHNTFHVNGMNARETTRMIAQHLKSSSPRFSPGAR